MIIIKKVSKKKTFKALKQIKTVKKQDTKTVNTLKILNAIFK